MFIEVNEIGRYNFNNEKNNNGECEYQDIIIGKSFINIDHIRAISITRFKWKDKKNYIVEEGSQGYCIYFDKDRYLYTDIESYNKIKEAISKESKKLGDYEKV